MADLLGDVHRGRLVGDGADERRRADEDGRRQTVRRHRADRGAADAAGPGRGQVQRNAEQVLHANVRDTVGLRTEQPPGQFARLVPE